MSNKLCKICEKPLSKSQAKYCSAACRHKGMSESMKGRKMSEKTKDLLRQKMKETYATGVPQQKIKNTLMANHGVENPGQMESHKHAIKKMKETYATGVPQQKIKNTLMANHGVENPMNIYSVKKYMSEINSRNALGNEIFEQMSSIDWWNKNYTSGTSLLDISKKLGISHSAAHVWANKLGITVNRSMQVSNIENQLFKVLENKGLNILQSQRILPSGKELDIYIPDHNLAIEVNSLYWHSELQGKSKSYHIDKTTECEKMGIRLLHFWDSELEEKFDICLDIILHACGHNSKIWARKCEVKEVDKSIANEFFNENHLQGTIIFKKAYGLIYEGNLMACMAFSKNRFGEGNELVRFSTLKGYCIVGGATKLLQYAPEGNLVSFADRRISVGTVYKQTGFELTNISAPSYQYTNYRTTFNRMRFQKKEQQKWNDKFDPTMTEWDNAIMAGFDRVWDCGLMKFEKTIPKRVKP